MAVPTSNMAGEEVFRGKTNQGSLKNQQLTARVEAWKPGRPDVPGPRTPSNRASQSQSCVWSLEGKWVSRKDNDTSALEFRAT